MKQYIHLEVFQPYTTCSHLYNYAYQSQAYGRMALHLNDLTGTRFAQYTGVKYTERKETEGNADNQINNVFFIQIKNSKL